MRQAERKLSQATHDLRLGRWDYLVAVPGMAFGVHMMPLTVLLLGFWLGWRFALVCTLAAVTTLAITDPLKHWFNRDRPELPRDSRAIRLRKLVRNPSFPSGDSAQAGVVTALLVVLGPLGWPGWLVFLPIAPACMFSRVYFGAHWWGDTVAGVAIGAAVALAYAHWFRALFG
jgi:membrane-associated phospholipid phosphatase